MNAEDLAWKLVPGPLLAHINYWGQYWFFGEWELRELRQLVRGRGLTIDVGANVGYYSYALKKLGRPVVSFEPDRIYQRRLRALLGRHARIEQVALSDEPGTGVMRVPHLDGAYGGTLGSLSAKAVPDGTVSTSYEVDLRTLDGYGFDEVAFIKVDVEGHEESVLAGARQTLQRCKPVILIEIEERHNPGGLDRIAESLSALGYSGHFYYKRTRHELSEFVADVHQNPGNVSNSHTSRRSLDYVNNFVFEVR